MKKGMLGWLILGMAVGSTVGKTSDIGIGGVIGQPSGLSAKISTGSINSVNLILGYDIVHRGSSLYAGGDYVWYNYGLIPVAKGKLPVYYGPGINASISAHPGVGVRGIFGIEYQFPDAPLDVFFELGPGLSILPSTSGGFALGLGMRFLF